MTRPHSEEEPSLKELMSQLSRDISQLVRCEISVAKTEVRESASKVQGPALSMAIGAMVALVGALTLVAALVLVLAQVMPSWLAALIVGAVFSIAGASMAVLGKQRIAKAELTPRGTQQALKRDALIMKEAIR